MVTRVGRGGLHYSLYGPLLPMLSLPGYWLGAMFDDPPPPPGSAEVGLGDWMALNTNQWISGAMVAVLFLIGVHCGLSSRLSAVLAILCAISTLIFPYSRDFFSQPLCAFLLTLSGYGILAFSRERRERFLWVAAVSAALLPWGRMDMGIAFVGLYLWVIIDSLKQSENLGKKRKEMMILSVPILTSLALLFFFDWYRWGRWSSSPYGEQNFNVPLIDSVPKFLFSVELSVFLYNPLLLLSFWFLARGWNEMKSLGIAILSIDAIYIVVVGKYQDYHGGICPGPRYFLSLVPFNLIPLFIGLSRLRNPKATAWAMVVLLATVGIAMNAYETLVDYTSAPPAWDYWMNLLMGMIEK